MKYGINILGLVPLRVGPKDQSEMISQVLFGQHFKVLEFKRFLFRYSLIIEAFLPI